MSIFESATTLIDVFGNIFDSNKGEWKGNRFIPGDLQNRFVRADQYRRQYGLALDEISYEKVYDILTQPGIWQNNIQAYYRNVKNAIADGTYVNPNYINPVPTTEPDITKNPLPDTTKTPTVQSGFSNNSLLIAILLGAGAFFMFSKS